MAHRTERLLAAITILILTTAILFTPIRAGAEPEQVATPTSPLSTIHEVETTPCDEPVTIIQYFTESDVILIAKMLYGEGKDLSTTEIACIAWVTLNRVDAGYGTIEQIITAPHQFSGYRASNPVTEKLYDIALDVLTRWQNEKNGQSDIGRVLPADYLWFTGNGHQNLFRDTYKTTGQYWDYQLPSPYTN